MFSNLLPICRSTESQKKNLKILNDRLSFQITTFTDILQSQAQGPQTKQGATSLLSPTFTAIITHRHRFEAQWRCEAGSGSAGYGCTSNKRDGTSGHVKLREVSVSMYPIWPSWHNVGLHKGFSWAQRDDTKPCYDVGQTEWSGRQHRSEKPQASTHPVIYVPLALYNHAYIEKNVTAAQKNTEEGCKSTERQVREWHSVYTKTRLRLHT